MKSLSYRLPNSSSYNLYQFVCLSVTTLYSCKADKLIKKKSLKYFIGLSQTTSLYEHIYLHCLCQLPHTLKQNTVKCQFLQKASALIISVYRPHFGILPS